MLNASSSKFIRNVSSSAANDSGVPGSPSSGTTQTSNFQFPIIASKLSEVYVWGGGKLLPKRIEFFKDETGPLIVALGSSHYAVITVEKELFTWSVKIIIQLNKIVFILLKIKIN
jgi:hypothetical protein